VAVEVAAADLCGGGGQGHSQDFTVEGGNQL
jgi:hypothetical protein